MATRTPQTPKAPAFMHDFKDDQVTIPANFAPDAEVGYRFLVMAKGTVTITLSNGPYTTGQARIESTFKREDGTGKPIAGEPMQMNGDKASGGNSARNTGPVPVEPGAYIAYLKLVKGTPYSQCFISIHYGKEKPAKPAGRR